MADERVMATVLYAIGVIALSCAATVGAALVLMIVIFRLPGKARADAQRLRAGKPASFRQALRDPARPAARVDPSRAASWWS